MLNKKQTSKRRSPFFIFSLFLHLALLFLFSLYSFKRVKLSTAKPKAELYELPASMKPQAGTLENSVFFDFSKPEPEPTLSKQEAAQKLVQSTASIPAQKVEEVKVEKQQPPKKELIKKFEDETSKFTLNKEEQKVKVEQEKPPKKILSQEELKKIALQNLFKEMPKQEAKSEEMPKPQKPDINQLITAQMHSPKQTAARIPMGVPGITKSLGFDLAERRGDDNKRPSLEELKYVCYLRKVAQCLHSDLHNIVQSFNSQQSGKVEILFEIGGNGTISGIEVEASSQRYLEQLLVQVIKAAAPFPPIPKYFKKNYFYSKVELNYKVSPQMRSMSGALYGFI